MHFLMSKLCFSETNVVFASLLNFCVNLAISLERGTFPSQINVTFKENFPIQMFHGTYHLEYLERGLE